MTKSALEAMNGINLFGDQGSSLSIIHVDPDAQYRNCVILNNLLPRESTSKETDASLLCITGYPAFAIDDLALCKKTEKKLKELLGVRDFLKRMDCLAMFFKDRPGSVSLSVPLALPLRICYEVPVVN